MESRKYGVMSVIGVTILDKNPKSIGPNTGQLISIFKFRKICHATKSVINNRRVKVEKCNPHSLSANTRSDVY